MEASAPARSLAPTPSAGLAESASVEIVGLSANTVRQRRRIDLSRRT